MDKNYVKAVLTSLVLVIVQAVLFNHLRIYTYFIPIVYMFAIFMLPSRTPRLVMLIFGAAVGLCMDLLMNSAGLNMAAATLAAYVRNPLLNLFLPDEPDNEGNVMISMWNMKLWKYLLYIACMVIIHTSTLLLLEAFSVNLFHNTLPYILGSSIMTIPIFFIIDIFYGKRRQRS